MATPLVAETLLGAPTIDSWCVMVQREVADRFFAEPGSKAYGAVSVVVRLHARRTGFHPVARTVFRPPPNVDSALVAFERVPPPADAAKVRRVVTAAFAHRRKTLANSLALAGVAAREPVVAALEAHRPPPGRPRGGARARRVRRAHVGAPGMSDWLEVSAPAKVNLALVVGPIRADGKHEVATVLERVELADTLGLREADATTVDGFPDDTLVRAALDAVSDASGTDAGASPRGSSSGSPSPRASAAARATQPPRWRSRTACSERPSRATRLHELASALGADVPFFLQEGPQLATGDGTTLEPIELPRDYAVLLALPNGVDQELDARRLRLVRRPGRRAGLRRAPCGAPRRPRRRPRAV